MAEHGPDVRGTVNDAWQAYDAWEAQGGASPSPGPIDAVASGLAALGCLAHADASLPLGVAVLRSVYEQDGKTKTSLVLLRNIH